MNSKRKKLVEKCRSKLVELKKSYEVSMNRPANYTNEGVAVDSATQENQIHQSSFFRTHISNILTEVNLALRRIEENRFGVCEMTGSLIDEKRLVAIPWARTCNKSIKRNRESY